MALSIVDLRRLIVGLNLQVLIHECTTLRCLPYYGLLTTYPCGVKTGTIHYSSHTCIAAICGCFARELGEELRIDEFLESALSDIPPQSINVVHVQSSPAPRVNKTHLNTKLYESQLTRPRHVLVEDLTNPRGWSACQHRPPSARQIFSRGRLHSHRSQHNHSFQVFHRVMAMDEAVGWCSDEDSA